jgi:hypothetical protein
VPFGNYWRKQAVGVLVAAPLPRAERVAEVEGNAGVDGEPDVLGHLLAAAGNAVPRAAAPSSGPCGLSGPKRRTGGTSYSSPCRNLGAVCCRSVPVVLEKRCEPGLIEGQVFTRRVGDAPMRGSPAVALRARHAYASVLLGAAGLRLRHPSCEGLMTAALGARDQGRAIRARSLPFGWFGGLALRGKALLGKQAPCRSTAFGLDDAPATVSRAVLDSSGDGPRAPRPADRRHRRLGLAAGVAAGRARVTLSGCSLDFSSRCAALCARDVR